MRLLPHLRWNPQTKPVVSSRSRVQARRAVRAFAVAVIVSHLGLSFALETYLPHLRDPDAGWKYAKLRTMTAGQPRIVALGSSRTQMGLAPASFGPTAPVVFNWGLPGAGPFHHRLGLARLEREGLRPDVLLIEILPAAMGNPVGAEQFIKLQPGRFSAADLQTMERDCEKTDGLWWQWAQQRINPWYEQRFLIMSHVVPSFLPWMLRQDYRWKGSDDFGWLGRSLDSTSPGEWEGRIARVKSEYEPAVKTLALAPQPDRVLRGLIADCRSRGIPVALYVMPESPQFRSWYGPGKLEALKVYFQTLRQELGVPVFDTLDWMPETDFADGHHLTKTGAQAFSGRFYRECLGPWLKTLPSK